MIALLDQQHQLEALLTQMQYVPYYALDTEFIKVDTLRPKLGVLQLNVNQQVYLLDGVKLNLSALWPQLFQAAQIHLHACSEDVDLICYYAQQQPLPNIFDTQVALAFLGHGLQLSYQKAVQLILNIHIDKDQTRSDWLARPLSSEQLQYAANDVLHLPQLVQHLTEQLRIRGLYDWVWQDCQNLSAEICQQTAAHQLYLDVATFRQSRRQLMQLQQLMQWRETLTQQANIPRSFIAKNAVLLELVEKNSRNLFQLAQIRDLRAQTIREHGKTLLQLLHELPDESLWPERIRKPPRLSAELTAQLDRIVHGAMLETAVPKEVLLRKKWYNALLCHAQDPTQPLPAYLTGWRYAILTQPMLQLIQTAQASNLV